IALIIENPDFETLCSFSGFCFSKDTTYLSINQIFNPFLKVPKKKHQIIGASFVSSDQPIVV
ncbi:MAG: hypothetical protein M0Q41_07960, partial [Bacteroidales bacterium]|nr:hypothetical protein [Bacteroidales bacterium]